MDTVRIVVIINAAFGNPRNLKIQRRYFLLFVDDTGTANIIHYDRTFCKRVTISVLVVEVHALIVTSDFEYFLVDLTENILGLPIQIAANMHSKSLFYLDAKFGTNTEKRLANDIFNKIVI